MGNLSQNSRYKILLKLYKKYKSSIKVVKAYEDKTCTLSIKAHDLYFIMQEIEKFPISWEFYSKQKFRFSKDFEDLIIFSYI